MNEHEKTKAVSHRLATETRGEKRADKKALWIILCLVAAIGAFPFFGWLERRAAIEGPPMHHDLLDSTLYDFDIPAAPVDKALGDWVKVSRVATIYMMETVGERRSPGVRGRFTSVQALDAILKDTGCLPVLTPHGLTIQCDSPPVAAPAESSP